MAICPSRFALQISHRYLHLLFNSPKKSQPRGPRLIFHSPSFESWESRCRVFISPSLSCLCRQMPSTRRDQPSPSLVSLPTLENLAWCHRHFLALSSFGAMLRRAYTNPPANSWMAMVWTIRESRRLIFGSALWHACARFECTRGTP